MGRGTHLEVLDGPGDPRVNPGRVGGPSGSYGTGRWTLRDFREIRWAQPKVRDGSEDRLKVPGRVGRSFGWSGTGRQVLPKVRKGSVDPRDFRDK